MHKGIVAIVFLGSFFSALPSNAASIYPDHGTISNIWTNSKISVCWENPTASNRTGRDWVTSAVKDTWEKHSQVRFVGWNKCSSRARREDGIRIRIADLHPHVKRLGRGLAGRRNGMVLNFSFSRTKGFANCEQQLRFCVRTIAVHEFGLALGLAHEHNRLDRKKQDPMCAEEPQGSRTNFYMTEYDPKSVMNYCNPNWNGNGQLSEADIVGVQWLYGIPCGPWEPNRKHSIRLYSGQTVRAMVPFNEGLITAFDQGGIYYSPYGNTPGGGCDTQRLYSGQRVLAMVRY